MFETLTSRLTQAIAQLTGQKELSQKNIAPVLSNIRRALIEADAALPVIDALMKAIEEKAIGLRIESGLKADEVMLQIVHDTLVATLQPPTSTELQFNTRPPAVILVAGLQGAGKTTTVAKLAHRLSCERKAVMVASTDTQRPGAMDQLQQLAQQHQLNCLATTPTEAPLSIANRALGEAKKQHIDVLIIDTAGRLHIDTPLIEELQALHKKLNPIETLFVVDSMTGQDAANTANVFHEKLPLTGTILTKMDGDGRGGAALSVGFITEKPVKFIGRGEKIEDLDAFDAKRIADQMLDQGDWMALLEKVQKHTDQKTSRDLEKRLKRGEFSLNDMAMQIEQMLKMGGIKGIMQHMPGAAGLKDSLDQVDEKPMVHMLALIRSMTPQEREHPMLLKGSRRNRVIKGSGTSAKILGQLLKQHKRMHGMIRKLKGRDLKAFMEQHMGEK